MQKRNGNRINKANKLLNFCCTKCLFCCRCYYQYPHLKSNRLSDGLNAELAVTLYSGTLLSMYVYKL